MASQSWRRQALVAAVAGCIVGLTFGVLTAYGAKRSQWLFPLSCPGIFLLDLLSMAPETRVGLSMPRIGLLAPANAALYGLFGLLMGIVVYRRARLHRLHQGTANKPADKTSAEIAGGSGQERFSFVRALATATIVFLLLIVVAAFLLRAALMLLADGWPLIADRSVGCPASHWCREHRFVLHFCRSRRT